MIRVENVYKSFRVKSSPQHCAVRTSRSARVTIDAVRNVSFECKPGRVFALLGPNGAGKTTLLRILSTLLTPGSGRIWVDGIDAVAHPGNARAHAGFLTGSSGLYDRMSGRETLRYFGSLFGMDAQTIARRTSELAQALGLDSYLDRRVGRYSTGMKQKLSIARTVLHDPQVILFDEPTSGLDVIGAKAIMDWIRRSRDQGKTVVFSTHRMDEVALIAQDLAIIHEGKLCYNGTLDGFMQIWPERSLEQAFLDALSSSSETEGKA